jgi:ribonuclease D
MSEDSLVEQVVPLLQPRMKTTLVDRDDELQQLVKNLEATTRIAIDAERASGFRYGQRAYLIQILIEKVGIYLVDTTIDFESTLLFNFKKLVSEKTWIIHAASQDIPCLAEYDLSPSSILDTELAGRILGLPKVSLGTMCEELLKLGLSKEHSAVDWSARPLPANWLNYAALDVDVLFDLWEAIENKLREANKYEYATQEFHHLTLPIEKPEKLDRWRSITGIHELKQARALTVIRSLWEAREKLAKEKDVAPGRLIPDLSLVAVVKAEPKSKSELASLRAFTGRASRSYLDLWWAAYEHGIQTQELVEIKAPSSGIPNHRNWPSKFPEANIRLQWMRVLLKDLSETALIPVENLMSPEIVRRICFSPPERSTEGLDSAVRSFGARSWQANLVVPLFVEALAKDQLPPTNEEASA